MRNRRPANQCCALGPTMAIAVLTTFCALAQAAPVAPSLTVTKTAQTSFVEEYQWDIDKTVNFPELILRVGESKTVNYTVTVDKTTTERDWAVSGNIAVHNPNSESATITGIADAIGSVAVTVNCGVALPYVLEAGATLNCSYSAPLGSRIDGTNTVTVTTSGLIEGGSGTAAFSFADAVITILGYDQVTVTDPRFTFSNLVSNDTTFTFDEIFQYSEPLVDSIINTAYLVEPGLSDSVTVRITVVPEPTTVALLGLGLAGLAAARRRRQ